MRVPGLTTKRPTPADIARKAAPFAGGVVAVGTATVAATRGGRAFLFGKARAITNAVTPSPAREYDDVTLARKVESEIFRDEDAPKSQVNVNAENGVVYLRRQVKNLEQIQAL